VALAKRVKRSTPWREDVVTLQTLDVVAKAWSEARTPSEQLAFVNEWRTEHGYPLLSARTLLEYRKRAITLFIEQSGESIEDRIAEHNLRHLHLVNRLYQEIDTTDDEKAKAIMYGHLQRTISEMPKYDGTTIIHVQQTVEHKSENEQAQELIKILLTRYGETEAAEVLKELKRLDAPKGEIIDVPSREIDASHDEGN
jgi:hypothetical protein